MYCKVFVSIKVYVFLQIHQNIKTLVFSKNCHLKYDSVLLQGLVKNRCTIVCLLNIFCGRHALHCPVHTYTCVLYQKFHCIVESQIADSLKCRPLVNPANFTRSRLPPDCKHYYEPLNYGRLSYLTKPMIIRAHMHIL